MLSVVWFLGTAFAASPASSIYVASNENEGIAVVDVGNPTVATAINTALPASGIVVDPVQNVVYTRETNGRHIYAFNALTLARIATKDILTPTGSGGALEIDPFRRILYSCDSDDVIRAYSLDASNYGTGIGASTVLTGIGATDQNQIVRDPTRNRLYATPNEGSAALVRVYSLTGHTFRATSWTGAGITTALAEDAGSLAFIPSANELLVHQSLQLRGMNRYDVSVFGVSLLAGTYTTMASNRTLGNSGAHYLATGANHWILETDQAANRVSIYDIDSGSRRTVTVPKPLGIEFYPLDEAEADDDRDGILDSVEVGATGLTNTGYNDIDPTTTTNPDKADSDGDGLVDGAEDLDHDGNYDAGETDPNNPDSDGDGVDDSEDCAPLDVLIYPGAVEACNTVDDDCDAAADEGVQTNYYDDLDGDGFGDAAALVKACESPEGFVGVAGDCDDTDPDISPDADEVCNDVDDNCDGVVDEGVKNTYFVDNDDDGVGQTANLVKACEQPANGATVGGDCNDEDATVFPGAPEQCNFRDDDCDLLIDAADPDYGGNISWFTDADGDGYGDPDLDVLSCKQPDGTVLNGDDCDDNASDVNPAANEVCNGDDDDCDFLTDENAIDAVTWYTDVDGDGYGDPFTAYDACEAAPGSVDKGGDCDDDNAAVSPGDSEVCNNVDDDCNGDIDDNAADAKLYYVDVDNDGYGTGDAELLCEGDTLNFGDCAPNDAGIYPGAIEIPGNGIDEDCDGVDGTVDTGETDTDTDTDAVDTDTGIIETGDTDTDIEDTDTDTETDTDTDSDSDSDSDSDADTDSDTDTNVDPDPAEHVAGGCECSTSGQGSLSAGWLMIAAALWIRRRKG